MRPYSINWIAGTATYFAAAGTGYTAGVPVALTSNYALFPIPLYGIQAPTNGYQLGIAQPPFGVMPQSARNVTITSPGNATATTFVISGLDQNGFFVTENLTGPNANTVTSANAYTIFNIVPSVNSTTTISVGMSVIGITRPFETDTWNKESLLSFEFSNVTGTVSITTIQMTNDVPFIPVNQNPVPNVRTWFTLPPDQTIAAYQPAVPFAVPIIANSMCSFREFPVTAVRLNVGATTTGTFTFTVLQQGAKY